MTGSAQREVVHRMLLPAIMRCVFLPSKLALQPALPQSAHNSIPVEVGPPATSSPAPGL